MGLEGSHRRSQTMLRTMLLASVAFTCAFAFHHPNAYPLTNFLPAAARRQPQGRVCSASMLGHRKHSVPGKIGTKGFANAAIQKVFHGYSVVLLHAQGEKPAEEAANTAIQSFFHAYSKTLLLIQNEGVKPAPRACEQGHPVLLPRLLHDTSAGAEPLPRGREPGRCWLSRVGVHVQRPGACGGLEAT